MKVEHGACLKRKNTCYENEFKAHADLQENFSKVLKAKLESRVDFESQTCNYQINLLKCIKEH